MLTGADPLHGGVACIYQIKTNVVRLLPALAGGAGAGGFGDS